MNGDIKWAVVGAGLIVVGGVIAGRDLIVRRRRA
jgi:hypothetical protein